ncbi:MAG: ornithine--oxo-acid transaminase [Deltaproteobacteria bacterium]|nr:ornithine--oxo-acid transaminase [Deltaproteobacteria bacterium]MBI3294861.1 ornithine--oxo-acid transaminase [Deltaproteobacteria bacterium]
MGLTQDLLKLGDRYGARNYKPLPVVLDRGEGAWVWDVDGKKYLDLLSAYSALNFGHSHPELVKVFQAQAAKLALCSRAFQSEELLHFCREMSEFCGMEATLPMNSGTEAIETALKVTRKWGALVKKVAENQANIVVMANNFHGRSITVISFSTEPIYRDHFGPYTPGFRIVPFGDAKALRQACDKNTIGVLLEPIQAEAGILIPSVGYLPEVRKICDEFRCLMILDEIQTGLSRTGREFCFQHESAKPDILVVGKSLGGGLMPVSAILTSRAVIDVIQPGEHGSTFGGNPLASAIARRSLKLLRELKLSERAEEIGRRVQKQLAELKSEKVRIVRGQGALLGIELHPSAGGARQYCEKLAEVGVLCKETHDHVVRIAPPLTIDFNDLHWGIERIIQVLR